MASHDYPIATRVVVDGVQAPCLAADLAAGLPTVLDGLEFSWGRSSTVDQPDIGSAQFIIREQLVGTVTPMLDVIKVGKTIQVWIDVTYPDASVIPYMVWAGVVTTLSGQQVADRAIEIAVTASDSLSLLSDDTVGDEPWGVQTASYRIGQILGLTRVWDPTPPAPAPYPDTSVIVSYSVDSTISDWRLTRLDVDAQPALGLIQNIAQSIGGVLWVLTNGNGVSLWIEDPSNRETVKQFVIDPDTGEVTIADTTGDSRELPACDVLRGVTWGQDKEQEINSVDVGWKLQVENTDGTLTTADRTVTVTEPDALIVRKLSVGTDLMDEIDARLLAARLIATSQATDEWTATGFTVDTRILEFDIDEAPYGHRLDTVVMLLDSTMRAGLGLTVSGTPVWAPGGESAPIFVEGGRYALDDGKWSLQLEVSSATGQGRSATFADFAGTGVRVMDFNRSITIADARGVAGPGSFGPGFGAGGFGVEPFGT